MQIFFRRHRKVFLTYGVLFLVATLFVLLFSISTSPIYRDYFSYGGATDGGDSLHYQTDGLAWLNGKVPYRDIFDHKGPIIFLVNMIGLLLGGGSRYGILPLQMLALTITLIFVWKIAQLAKKSYLWGAISVLVTLIFMTACYASGNSVQEYNLPFIMVAIYFMVKYFYTEKTGEHNPWWAFAYGVAVGSCLLLQLTHAIPICAGALVIGIILIKQKLWKNLWKNILFGACGLLAIWLPFALYFLLNGAFGDFIYCTLIFNFSYAGKIGSWLKQMNSETIAYFFATYVPFFCVFGASVLAFVRGKKAYAGMLMLTFLLEAYLFFSAAIFSQYPLPAIFQIGLFLNEIILFEHKEEVRRVSYISMISLVTLLAYNQFVGRLGSLVDQYNAIRGSVGDNSIGYERLMNKYLDKFKEDSFTVYGETSIKGLYVRYGIVPSNKYPMIQNWSASFTDKVKDDMYEDFLTNKATYLLADQSFIDVSTNGIKEILNEYYRPVDKDGEFVLYQLRRLGNNE